VDAHAEQMTPVVNAVMVANIKAFILHALEVLFTS
jgi:hypothetical protein